MGGTAAEHPTGPEARRRADGAPADDGRDETKAEHADRNWAEIVQELRVTQTGTQLLSGFLLSLAFQQAFQHLPAEQKTVYMVLVVVAAVATILTLLPVSMHRALFREGVKRDLVRIGDRVLRLSMGLVSVLTVGIVYFLFDVVVSRQSAIVAGTVAAAVTICVLLIYPTVTRRRQRARDQ